MTHPTDGLFPKDVCKVKRFTPRVLKSGEHDLRTRTKGGDNVKKDLKNS